MEEEKNNENIEKEEKAENKTEELKQETVETVKQVKETFKNTNFKDETKETKGFLVKMFQNPLETIKEVANDTTTKYLSIAIIFLVLWTVFILISATQSTLYIWGWKRFFENTLTIIKKVLAPVFGIAIYSLIAFLLNKDNKKPLTTVISTVTIAHLPTVIAALFTLLTMFSSRIAIITVPFSYLCSSLSIVLVFFGFKHLFGGEKCTKLFKKYVLIQAIYYAAYIVIGLLGIYI